MSRENELKSRQTELTHIEKRIAQLLLEGEKGEDLDEAGAEIARLLAVKGKHKTEIARLSSKTFPFQFHVTKQVRTASLTPGITVRLPAPMKPRLVVWCPTLELVSEEVVVLTEGLNDIVVPVIKPVANEGCTITCLPSCRAVRSSFIFSCPHCGYNGSRLRCNQCGRCSE